MKKRLVFTILILNNFLGFSFSQNLKIENISIIDVIEGKEIPGQDIWINNGRITYLNQHFDSTGFETNIIDGFGKFLIPGFFDMHAHFGPDAWLKMYLQFGITGIRVMAGNDRLLSMRDSIQLSQHSHPDLYIASPLLDGNPPLWGEQHTGPLIGQDTDIQSILNEFQIKGYDEIKVYNRLPIEQYIEILERADQMGLKVSGHLPYQLPESYLADPRHQSIEHMDGLVQFATDRNMDWSIIGQEEEMRKVLYKEVSLDDFGPVSQKIKKNNVWLTPTLSLYGNMGDSNIRKQIAANPYKDELTGLFGFWRSLERLNEEFALKYQIHQKVLNKYFLDYHEHILPGTDSPNPFNPPGQSLHFELVHLSRTGFSKAQILQIATYNAAKYLGIEEDKGSIEIGKIADLLILNQNPLENIEVTTDIHMVLKDGKLVLLQ
jgi:hypothetical protein